MFFLQRQATSNASSDLADMNIRVSKSGFRLQFPQKETALRLDVYSIAERTCARWLSWGLVLSAVIYAVSNVSNLPNSRYLSVRTQTVTDYLLEYITLKSKVYVSYSHLGLRPIMDDQAY